MPATAEPENARRRDVKRHSDEEIMLNRKISRSVPGAGLKNEVPPGVREDYSSSSEMSSRQRQGRGEESLFGSSMRLKSRSRDC